MVLRIDRQQELSAPAILSSLTIGLDGLLKVAKGVDNVLIFLIPAQLKINEQRAS